MGLREAFSGLRQDKLRLILAGAVETRAVFIEKGARKRLDRGGPAAAGDSEACRVPARLGQPAPSVCQLAGEVRPACERITKIS